MALATPIGERDSRVNVKQVVGSLVDWVNGVGASDALLTRAQVRAAINAIAGGVSLPTLGANDLGSRARGKINALIPALGLDEGSALWRFAEGRYWIDEPVQLAEALSCSRASTGLALNADGAWVAFAADVPRITDRGLLVEPAATNLLTRSNDPANAAWTNKDNVTVGATIAGWTPVRETVTNNFHRLFRANTTSVAGPHTHEFWIKKVGRRHIGARVSLDGGVAYVNIGFDLDTLTVTLLPAGFTASIEKVGPVYRLVWGYTNSSTAIVGGIFTSDTAIVSGVALPTFVGDTGQGFDLYNAQIEATAFGTSPIITAASTAARAADAVTLAALPAGTHDLTVTFDDDSTQVIAGESGSVALPTNLNRRYVKSLLAEAA